MYGLLVEDAQGWDYATHVWRKADSTSYREDLDDTLAAPGDAAVLAADRALLAELGVTGQGIEG